MKSIMKSRPLPQTSGRAPVLNWDECPAVVRDSEKLAGTPLFKHSRVPLYALFENLQGGATIDDFLDLFDGITKEQVETVLQFTAQNLKDIRAYSIRP